MRYIMAIVHLSGPEIFETAAALLDFDGIETEHITTDCVHGFVLDMLVYKERASEIPWDDYDMDQGRFLRDNIKFYLHDFQSETRFLWFVVDA